MRSLRPFAIAAALCLASSDLLAQRQLQLLVTVVDPSGAEVTSIDPKEVLVTENGVAGTAVKVEPVERVPKVQVLVDNGIGMPGESIGDLRKGLRGLLEALPAGIEVTMVTTAPQPRFLERATTDREKLIASLDKLAPDNGAGRFVESLYEATERIERDKNQDASYTIVAIGTSSGDTNVRDRDLQRIMERIQQRRTTVHVVLLSQVARTASAGVIQGELGEAAAGATGGRFEKIAVPNRIVTLLPEIGAQLGKTLGAGSRQFRVLVERPSGASGDLGTVSLGVAGKEVSSVTFDRR